LLEMNRFVARDDALAIDLDARDAARGRAGGDDDLLPRRQRLFVAVEDVDTALAGEPGRALDPINLVLLEQELDAFGQTRDNPVLPCVHLSDVDAGRRYTCNAPLLGGLDHFQRVRVLEQRLGRNAAPVETGASERFLLLDNGGLQAELRGANRR